jgi:Ca2+-binding EF-hand superfamily protein
MKILRLSIIALVVLLSSGCLMAVRAVRRAARPAPESSTLMHALDLDRDGTINATELANASAALKGLDRNNDGQLTTDELKSP